MNQSDEERQVLFNYEVNARSYTRKSKRQVGIERRRGGSKKKEDELRCQQNICT